MENLDEISSVPEREPEKRFKTSEEEDFKVNLALNYIPTAL